MRRMNHPESNRIWKVDGLDEAKALSEFLGVCAWKLTQSEMAELNQQDIQKVFEALRAGKVTIEQIKKLSSDELYDLIVGQLRLF